MSNKSNKKGSTVLNKKDPRKEEPQAQEQSNRAAAPNGDRSRQEQDRAARK